MALFSQLVAPSYGYSAWRGGLLAYEYTNGKHWQTNTTCSEPRRMMPGICLRAV